MSKKKKESKKVAASENSFNWKNYWQPAVIAMAAFTLYAKTLGFDFVYHDDDTMITTNTVTLKNASFKTVFLTDAWFRSKEIELYRPWQSLTFVLDYKLWGIDAKGYHLHNIIVFAVALVMLYYFLITIGFNPAWSFALTLFYACHYLFAHTVSWIPARGDLYLTLFGIAACYFFLNYLRQPSLKKLLLANGLLFMALLAKETAIIILPATVLLRWAELNFDLKQWKKLAGWWMLVSAVPMVVYFLFRNQSIAPNPYVSFKGGLYNLPVIPESVFKFFVPLTFCVLPSYNTTFTIAGTVIILLMMAVFVWRLKTPNRHMMAAGFIFFLMALLPSLFYKPNFSGFAYDYLDHRMFFAGVGLLVFTGSALASFQKHIILLQRIVIGLCVVEAVFSFTYQEAYRNYHRYYTNGLTTNPKSALAALNYGILLRQKDKDYQKSVEVLNKGLAAYPDSSVFLIEKAGSFFAMQQKDSMFAVAQQIAAFPDRQYEALVYKGIYYSEINTDSALAMLNAAIVLKPNEPRTYFNRSVVFISLKRTEDALRDLSEAIRLLPDYAEALSTRGNIYGNMGLFDKALADYDRYVRLRPDDAVGYFYRGQAYILTGRKFEGCNDLQKAVAMGQPDAKLKLAELCK